MADIKIQEQINNIIHETLSYDLIYDQDEVTIIVEALRKQIPQKVRVQNYFYGYVYSCPCCDHFLTTVKEHTVDYCSKCGQALDWSET